MAVYVVTIRLSNADIGESERLDDLARQALADLEAEGPQHHLTLALRCLVEQDADPAVAERAARHLASVLRQGARRPVRVLVGDIAGQP
jgi:hypothetical protein